MNGHAFVLSLDQLYRQRLPAAISTAEHLLEPAVHVSKSKRIMTVYDRGEVVCSTDVLIGKDDTGPKEVEGDLRTPEGDYRICFSGFSDMYRYELVLDYPNILDAERGLRDGIINQQVYSEIITAHKNNIPPPFLTKLGGQIMLHGGGLDRDPTKGCIAASNSFNEYLKSNVYYHTPVRIDP